MNFDLYSDLDWQDYRADEDDQILTEPIPTQFGAVQVLFRPVFGTATV